MVLAWIGWAVVQATTLNAYGIEFDGRQLFSNKLRSSRATVQILAKRDARTIAVRLYGVEAFSASEHGAIETAKAVYYAANPKRSSCGTLDPTACLSLASLFYKPGDPSPLKLLIRGKDSDGTLVIDYRFDSETMLSTLLLRMGSFKIDPKIIGKDTVATKEAFEAKQRLEGNWRWLPEIIPPLP